MPDCQLPIAVPLNREECRQLALLVLATINRIDEILDRALAPGEVCPGSL